MRGHSIEFQKRVIDIYEEEGITIKRLAERFSIGYTATKRMISRHKRGIPLQLQKISKHPLELKKEIAEFSKLNPEMGLEKLGLKFNVSISSVSRWIGRTEYDCRRKKTGIIKAVLPKRTKEETAENCRMLERVTMYGGNSNKWLRGEI